MRLDLVLKQSGIIKRRTIAKALADNGRILVNGKVAKPSFEVKEGDVIKATLGKRESEVVIHFVQKGKRLMPEFEVIKNEIEDQ